MSNVSDPITARKQASKLGVCSWSLQPDGPANLVESINTCGLSAVQLALDPVSSGRWDLTTTRASLSDAGIEVLSGMMEMTGEDYSSLESIHRTGGVRPDATWEENQSSAQRNADTAAEFGLDLVTFHAGFLPGDANDASRGLMVDRLGKLAETFGDRGVRVGFETGQETADTLISVLAEINDERVGVNFDPANMILYGMGDPGDAFEQLLPHVMQVHIKDATPSDEPGSTWGEEVVVGTGLVDWDRFFRVLGGMDRPVHRLIEREAGDERVEDVRSARAVVEALA